MIRLILIAFFLVCDCTNLRGESALSFRSAKHSQSVYVVPGMIADFSRDRKAQESFGRSIGAVTTVRGAVAVYRMPVGKKLSQLSATQSQVFSDSPRGGNLRALPGGAVVTFSPAKDESDARKWARNHGVELERRLVETSEKAVWLVKTVAGVEGLQVVSRLDESADVASVEPNWWLDIRAR